MTQNINYSDRVYLTSELRDEVAKVLLPETHPAKKILDDIFSNCDHLDIHELKSRNFSLWKKGTEVYVLRHERLEKFNLVVKFPKLIKIKNPKCILKKALGHFYTNEFISDHGIKKIVVSQNWLYPLQKGKANEGESYGKFRSQKEKLEKNSDYYERTQIVGNAIFNKFVLIETKLTIVNETVHERISQIFDQVLFKELESFLLYIGDTDISNDGNLLMTGKDQLAFVDVHWTKSSKKRFRQGTGNMLSIAPMIPEQFRQEWAQRYSTNNDTVKKPHSNEETAPKMIVPKKEHSCCIV